MAWKFTTSGMAILKAGQNANTNMSAQAIFKDLSTLAEGNIMSECRRDFSGGYASLNAAVKGVLSDVCSSMIAKQIIQYDMSGFTGKREAETMLDVQDDIIRQGIAFLKDFKSTEIKDI